MDETKELPEPLPKARRRIRRVTTVTLVTVGLVGVYAILGFLVLPAILKTKLPEILSKQLGHPVAVREVSFNPFALALTITGFEVTEQDKTPLLGFEELYANVALASLINQALTFDHIRLLLPYGIIKVRPDGTVNLSDLVPKPDSPQALQATDPHAAEPTEDKTIFPLIIKLLEIDQGILEFHDKRKHPPFNRDVVPIRLVLRNFRTVQAGENALALHAELASGETVEWQGTVFLNPLSSDGQVALNGIKVRNLWQYVQDQVRFEITGGTIDFKATYHAEFGGETPQVQVSAAEFRLQDFGLSEKGDQTPLISLPLLVLEEVQADLLKHHVDIAAVRSKDARVRGWLEKDGKVNFQRLLVSADQAQGDTKTDRPAPVPSKRPPWSITLKEITLDNYGVAVEDRKPTPAVHLDLVPINVSVANLTYPSTSPFDVEVAVGINGTETVSAAGSVQLEPVTAELRVNVARVPLTPFQPYIDQVAHVRLNSGWANAKGRFQYAASAQQSPRIHYQGDASLTQFATVDTLLNKDFVTWEALAVNGIDLTLQPMSVTIAEVRAQKPYARIIIGPDRTVNVTTILVKSDGSKSEHSAASSHDGTAAPPEPPPITIGAVRIIDGSVHFGDFSLRPIVDTGIYKLNGTIKGLSSKAVARANVAINGQVDRYAPVTIAGHINPLSSDTFSDLLVSFKNVELTTASPYSTRFAGYPIVKGKLSMDLKYHLSHKTLDAENEVIIDQLTLGEKVESPDAISLPVKLAVALLKDRHGRIDIDLPVKGDLNNPEFRYGKVLWNVFVNLLTKAVTSPFAFIGSLVGGNGEELAEVAFPLGSAELQPDKESKLQTLAKSLEDRPELRLEVAGTVDPSADRAALAEAGLYNALSVLKQEEEKTQNKPMPSGSQVVELAGAEYASLLKTLYVKKFGDLPEADVRDPTQPNGAVNLENLKAQLLEAFKVPDTELHLLAQERAKRMRDFLVDRAGVPAERVFLLDVKLDGKAQDSTVISKLGLSAG